MDSCWASGGPEWLFVAALTGLGMAVPFGVLTWVAWAPPRPEPSRGERIFSILLSAVSFGYCTFVFLAGHPGAQHFAFVGVTAAAAAALVVVVKRAHRALRDGVQLVGGMAVAYGVVRWSTVVIASAAATIGAASVLTMLALGHSCTGH